MFTKEDILAKLREGASIDDIASETANAINEAVATYEAEKKASEEARLKKENERNSKIEMLNDILSDITLFINLFYPEWKDVMDFEYTFDDLGEVIDEFDALVSETQKFLGKVEKSNTNKTSYNYEDIINKFFKENNI